MGYIRIIIMKVLTTIHTKVILCAINSNRKEPQEQFHMNSHRKFAKVDYVSIIFIAATTKSWNSKEY